MNHASCIALTLTLTISGFQRLKNEDTIELFSIEFCFESVILFIVTRTFKQNLNNSYFETRKKPHLPTLKLERKFKDFLNLRSRKPVFK